MHVDLFFKYYFKLLIVEAEINKTGLNLINLEGS